MAKIYSRTGDSGETSLIGGKRVPKFHELVEIYGTIDELTAFIGVLYDLIESFESERTLLMVIQKTLFKIESFYASEMSEEYDIALGEISFLEDKIDELYKEPIRTFIIPGGNLASSYAHVCRTICRRCERLSCRIDNSSHSLVYLNRLSDLLFVLAMVLSKK